MVALLLTAFALPQEEQAEPADTSDYAFMKADLTKARRQLIEQLANIEWTLRYIDVIEIIENDTTSTEVEIEESE